MDTQSRVRSNRKPGDTAPGGAPELSPEIKRLRLKMLTGLRHMGFVEAIKALKAKLGSEEKEMMRLGNLAARLPLSTRRRKRAALRAPWQSSISCARPPGEVDPKHLRVKTGAVRIAPGAG
jgi:hypothetical protein